MIFHCGCPQKHQQTGAAGLLVLLWPSLYLKCMIFHCGCLQKHQQTGAAGLLVLLWPFLLEMHDFSLRVPTEAPADRRCQSAGAVVAVSTGNA